MLTYEIYYLDSPAPEYIDAVEDTITEGVLLLQGEEVNTVIPFSAICWVRILVSVIR